jgi:hypothetical protein
LLPELVRSHVSVQGASDPRPAPAAVVAVVPVEAAALPGLAVPPLHLLVDEIFEVLLPYLGLLVFDPVLGDVLLGLVVEGEHQLEALVDLRVLVQLDPPDVVRVQHVPVQPPHLVRAVLALDIIGEYLDVAADLPDESVPRPLEHQTDGKVGVVLFLLQAGVGEPPFVRYVALLLVRQLLAHDLLARDLADDELLLR